MIIVVWGSDIARDSLGWVADFCPFCRAACVFHIIGLRRTSHVYGVTLGHGSELGNLKVCKQCGTESVAEFKSYKSLGDELDPVESLIKATNPGLGNHTKGRLEKEERVKTGTLTPADRLLLISEPFVEVEYELAKARAKSSAIDARAAVVMILTFFICLGCGIAAVNVQEWRSEFWMGAFGSFVAGLLTVTGFLIHNHLRYGVKVHPLLVKSLLPIQPRLQEMQQILTALRKQGYSVGRVIDPARLMAELEVARQSQRS